MTDDSPFHAGEREIQELIGERAMAERNGGMIGAAIPRGAIGFLAQQRFIVVGSLDAAGQPWASVLIGGEGLATADAAGTHVELDLARARVALADVLWANLGVAPGETAPDASAGSNAAGMTAPSMGPPLGPDAGPRVGLLAIELTSRRRLRINGRVTSRTGSDSSLSVGVTVDEAYPNCPKYIQRRHLGNLDAQADPAPDTQARVGEALDADQAELIRRADTLFVASVHAERGVDASHRGGVPGFVEVAGDGVLRIPDYSGNSMYNTLGNLRAEPRAGLVFLDFATSRVVQVVGRTRTLLGEPDPRGLTGGTGRFWELHPERVRSWNLGGGIGWEFLEASPFNPEPADEAAAPG